MVERLDVPDRDMAKAHPLLQSRWKQLKPELETKHGISLREIEVYRPDRRQQWLYGAGRTVEQCALKHVSPEFARPTDKIVTNAWSAATGAHCWHETVDGLLVPASCAMDVCPVGADGRPWTPDDRWDDFVRLTDDVADLGGQIGLIHFHAAGKDVWDRPHLQLIEWNDHEHRLILPEV